MMATRSLAGSLWRDHAGKFLRYSGVSAFNVISGQVLLLVFYRYLGQPAWTANVAAVVFGSIPAFILNKRFVWRRSGKVNLRTEMLPFWGMNLVGLLLSSVAVHVAASVWDTQLAVNAASLGAWGSLWVGKYFLLDRLLMREEVAPVTTG